MKKKVLEMLFLHIGPKTQEYIRLGTSAFSLGYLEVWPSLVPLVPLVSLVFGSSHYTWKDQIACSADDFT